jgi:hypothetical protein
LRQNASLQSIVQQAFKQELADFFFAPTGPEFRVASHAVNSHQLQSTEARFSILI